MRKKVARRSTKGPHGQKCAICGELTKPYHSLCSACTSWWYRITVKTPDELAAYLRKQTRMSDRIVYWRNNRKAAA